MRYLTEYFADGQVIYSVKGTPTHQVGDLLVIKDKRYIISIYHFEWSPTLTYQVYTLMWEPEMYLQIAQLLQL